MQSHSSFDADALPLYIHGLEGSAQGSKGTFMLNTFGRSGPNMPAKKGVSGGRPSSFETCIDVIKDYLDTHSASVLVGSSFGGAVTMAILQRNIWHGPVVLLAPAIHYYGLDLDLPSEVHAIIIHDPQDDLIHFSGSEALHQANLNSSELWVSDGGHRLKTITQNGLLEQAVRDQLKRARGH